MGPGSGGGPHGPGQGTHRGTMHGDSAMSPRGPANGSSGGESTDDWMADVDGYDGLVDRRNRSAVTVRVGARGNGGYLAFAPPVLRVSRGTTITWEWTGQGGVHDVVALDGGFANDRTAAAGATYGVAFDAPGTHRYYCTPHRALGMKGVVVVD